MRTMRHEALLPNWTIAWAYDDLIDNVVPAFNRVWSGRVGSVTPLPSARGNEQN